MGIGVSHPSPHIVTQALSVLLCCLQGAPCLPILPVLSSPQGQGDPALFFSVPPRAFVQQGDALVHQSGADVSPCSQRSEYPSSSALVLSLSSHLSSQQAQHGRGSSAQIYCSLSSASNRALGLTWVPLPLWPEATWLMREDIGVG